jgi:serine protease Do
MMKITSYVLSGVLGGLLVLGGSRVFENIDKVHNAPTFKQYSLPVNQNISKAYPADFSLAANNSLHSVVHIKAAENKDLAMQRYRNQRAGSPWDDFFGGNPFFGMGPRVRQGSGSGVIISEDGYIVTNNHVIDFADELEVTLHDGRKFSARKIGLDPKSDLAVIKVDGAHQLKPIVYGDSDKMEIGNWVLAVGNPFDLTSTVTAGIISAKGRDLGIIRAKDAIEDFIQTDAAVNPGNSGGALVDMEGKLIGINTAIATPTGTYAGYSFSIPVNLMRGIVDDLIEHGSYEKPTLGIVAYELDEEIAEEENFSVNYGVAIAELDRGGSAQMSGLLPRDVIRSVDGVPVNKVSELINQLKSRKVGDKIKVRVNRSGLDKDIVVMLRPGPTH